MTRIVRNTEPLGQPEIPDPQPPSPTIKKRIGDPDLGYPARAGGDRLGLGT